MTPTDASDVGMGYPSLIVFLATFAVVLALGIVLILLTVVLAVRWRASTAPATSPKNGGMPRKDKGEQIRQVLSPHLTAEDGEIAYALAYEVPGFWAGYLLGIFSSFLMKSYVFALTPNRIVLVRVSVTFREKDCKKYELAQLQRVQIKKQLGGLMGRKFRILRLRLSNGDRYDLRIGPPYCVPKHAEYAETILATMRQHPAFSE